MNAILRQLQSLTLATSTSSTSSLSSRRLANLVRPTTLRLGQLPYLEASATAAESTRIGTCMNFEKKKQLLTQQQHPVLLQQRRFSIKSSSVVSATAEKVQDNGVSLLVDKSSLSPVTSNVLVDDQGQHFGIVIDTRKLPKLKPSIVNSRMANLKTYFGKERQIRQSPWKLNRVCQLASGLTVEDALTQLKFCDIKNADLVFKLIRKTSNLADIHDGLQPSQLEVAECFTTKGPMAKRYRFMARGRVGRMHRKYSHIRVMLREIDFPLKIHQATSKNKKQKWMIHQARAQREWEQAKAKRTEMERLQKEHDKKLVQEKQEASKK